MEGHLRGIIGQLSVEQIVKEPEMVGDRMRSTCAEDMSKMGLEVVSFTIKEVRDKNEYIANMGRPDVARIKPRRRCRGGRSGTRHGHQAGGGHARGPRLPKPRRTRSGCSPRRCRWPSRRRPQRDLEIKKAEYQEATKKHQAQADKAYDIQSNVMQQQVVAEQVKVLPGRKERADQGAGGGDQRHESELIATMLKQAEIERRRIETLAEAEKQRLDCRSRRPCRQKRSMAKRTPRSSASREAPRPRSFFKKGEAEAKAMNVKAEAYQGLEPGGRRRQAHHRFAGGGEGAGVAAGQRGQDHDRVHGQRRRRGHEQDHRRYREDGGADPGVIRDALGHADVGPAGEGAADRRTRSAARRRSARVNSRRTAARNKPPFAG